MDLHATLYIFPSEGLRPLPVLGIIGPHEASIVDGDRAHLHGNFVVEEMLNIWLIYGIYMV